MCWVARARLAQLQDGGSSRAGTGWPAAVAPGSAATRCNMEAPLRTVDGQYLGLAATGRAPKRKRGGAQQQAEAERAAARARALLPAQAPGEDLQRVAVHEAQRGRQQEARGDGQHAAGATHAARRLLRGQVGAAAEAAGGQRRGGLGVAAHDGVCQAQLPECELQAPVVWR